ncbi:BrnT family toxin [Patescibacteria group bacterium]|nr:BrnT family toxin [Patescibacteria group bacterium]
MKYFDWDDEKNDWLIANRGISFETIKECLETGGLLAIEENHPPYQHQKILIVQIDDYVYEVPYVRDEEKVFFKTIYPSRRATKKYLQ